jgi:NitT/TauT family transport system substrate-binding protein
MLFLACFQTVLAGDEPKPRIRFFPQWSVQSQFAGYYMARKKGIYEKHGIDVDIISGGPNSPTIEKLRSGEADIVTLFLSTGIKERAHGTPLVNIGQISKHSALIFIAKTSSGISGVKDIGGRKLGLWRSDFQDIPLAFLSESGVSAEIIPISSTINLFLRGGMDLMTVMCYNEYHTVLNSGLNPDELVAFHFSKHGFDIPEDGIYCLEENYREKKDAFRAFVKASLEGWEYAFSHQDETVDTIMEEMKLAHIPANRAHQRWMLSEMKDLIAEDECGNRISGLLDKTAYSKTAEILKKNGKIEKIPPFDEFFMGAEDKGGGK